MAPRKKGSPKTMMTLAKYFTYALASGGSFTSEWVSVPEGNQNWQLTVIIHSRISTSSATFQLATSWDTVGTATAGASVDADVVAVNVQDITTGMGPMVRFTISAAADSVGTISVYLTPKSD